MLTNHYSSMKAEMNTDAAESEPELPPRVRVAEKWGFGMAPVKVATDSERKRAARTVLSGVLEDRLPSSEDMEDLSIIKGLFSRCYNQDQWDWFTVWRSLGQPGRVQSQRLANAVAELRQVVAPQHEVARRVARARIRQLGGVVCLERFLSGGVRANEGVGYIYVLSTRNAPNLLKVGYTERQVEERVREINAATGVAIPFGVRPLWTVKNARIVESDIHELLKDYRVRSDREFFDLDFRYAFPIIRDYVYETRAET